MATMDLVSSFHHSYKFKNQIHVYMRFSIDVQVSSELIRYRTYAAPAVKEHRKQNSNSISKNKNFNIVCREGLLKQALAHQEISGDSSVPSLLQACTNVETLKQVHAQMILTGIEQTISLKARLVRMYAMRGNMENARLVFDKISKPNVFLWNAMIRGYARSEPCREALTLYYQMQQVGIQPDNFTFPFVLKACASLSALQEGKEIHDDIVRIGLESDNFVRTALIDMYAKCGSIDFARLLFDKMSDRNVVSWNAIIAGYAQNGDAREALTLFRQMQLSEVKPDLITMVGLLLALTHLAALQQGKWMHGYIIKSGFESDDFVGNSLMDMYAKCGCLDIACQMFDKLSKRDPVSWNAMIVGYMQNGDANEALELYNQMQLTDVKPNAGTLASILQACTHLGGINKGYAQSGHASEALTLFLEMQLADVMPNSVTMVSALPACAHLAALQQGKCIHGYIIKSGFESDIAVGTALIDMYAKCGSIEIARQFFDKMSKRNVISWSAMIAGYGMHGLGKDALALFCQMQQTGIMPNHITFVCVLSACSHAGLLDEGWQLFECMFQDHYITPRGEHYACMVDLLGRAGRLDEAQDFIKHMPLEPGVSVWGALLSACRIHSNIELGQRVAEHLFHLEPEKAGSYVLLSNIYAAAGRWDDVAKVRAVMKDKGVKKAPGCSLIEINNKVHTFLVRDRSHPQSEEIYALLETLAGQMKEAGYVPNTNCVLHDVDE
eukprot:Gb_15537 [translate_table: standard]